MSNKERTGLIIRSTGEDRLPHRQHVRLTTPFADGAAIDAPATQALSKEYPHHKQRLVGVVPPISGTDQPR